MTQIGHFTRTKSGYTGRISTLTLDRELTLLPAESSDTENAPDYRVHRSNGSGSEIGTEVGAAWKRTGEKAGDYLSQQLDDPAFDRPIRANLFKLDAENDTWMLQWNRPRSVATRTETMSRMYHLHKGGPATSKLPSARGGLFLLSGLLAFGAALPVFPACASAQTTTTATRSAVDPYSAYVTEASQRFRLPERLLRAVMTAESDGFARAISSKGAMGLMQIMPDTWIELSTQYRLGNDPFDPRDNILAGTAYLRELHDQYGSPGFLAAYNAGPGCYEEYLVDGRPLPAETRNYVAVLAPYVDASAASLAAIPVRINRSDWTQSPLFVAQADGGAASVPSGSSVKPSTVTQTQADGTDVGLAPRNSGLFVTPSQATKRQ